MHLKMYTVDSFSSEPFRGNPAAVCLLQNATDLDEATMQKIAAEMALSETAFVSPSDSTSGGTDFGGCGFKLRWFTPTCEVPLCGHATLATAAVITSELGNASDSIHFSTLSGTLVVARSVCCQHGHHHFSSHVISALAFNRLRQDTSPWNFQLHLPSHGARTQICPVFLKQCSAVMSALCIK